MSTEKISRDSIYCSTLDWRTSRYHFSFADYNNPDRMSFGVLRALNDELIQSNRGFELHPHNDMEILSYCVQGELNHMDNMGNDAIIRRGDIQYMCAGSGIMHAEMNPSKDQPLRFVQIWLLPNKDGLIPHYEHKRITKPDRTNKWLQVASGNGSSGGFQIHQDANVYISELDRDVQIEFNTEHNRQSYVTCIEGEAVVNTTMLEQHDALRILGNQRAVFHAVTKTHLLLVEMAQTQSDSSLSGIESE